VHSKLWHRAEEYCVRMHAVNLSLRGENTHSNVHMGVQVLHNTEEFGCCMHSMSISCLTIVYSMVRVDYCARWNMLNFGMVQCIGKNSCEILVHDTKTVHSGY
jgi:hypothetical protein